MHYRAIWISDVHLGTSGCQANYLLDFLRHNEADQFYLVGDIIVSGSLLICRLSKLRTVMDDGVCLPNVAPRCAGLEDAILQARTDARVGWLPIVLARQDDEEWLLAWREEHDTRLMEEVRKWLDGSTKPI